MPALKVADRFGLPSFHAEQVGRARHVDVEKGAAHQEIACFRGDILRELGQPLRRDRAREAALAPAAHQVRHRRQRRAANGIGHLSRRTRGEHLRLVNHDEGGKPVLARGIEQRVQKDRGTPHLRLDVERIERDDHRRPMLANARGDRRDLALAIVTGVDHDVVVSVGERDEIALGIDHDLLDEAGAFFEEPAKQVGFSRSRIALDEQARREEFLHIDVNGCPPVVGSNFDAAVHGFRTYRCA